MAPAAPETPGARFLRPQESRDKHASALSETFG